MMDCLSDGIQKLRNDVNALSARLDYQLGLIGELRGALNLGGEYNNILMLMNVLEDQKRMTNEVLYAHIQEHKPVVRKSFNPLVSVIIPVYFKNGPDIGMHRQYLTKAVSSVVKQTYGFVEGIVVNDGCGEPETRLIDDVIKDMGPNIRYFRKENGGTSSALNFGVSQMKGDYFAWLSHDDYFYPAHIETHIGHLRKTPVEEKIITSSLVEIVDENSNTMLSETMFDSVYGKDYKRSLLKRERSYNVNTIGGCSVLIPKAAFEKYGLFDLEARATHEYELWRRIESEYSFFTIPIFTHTYRVHQNSEHSRIANLSQVVFKEKLRIINEVPDTEYLALYGTEANFLHVLKTLYYLNCHEHKMIVDSLNRRLNGLGYTQ